jgi:hypothetical protein
MACDIVGFINTEDPIVSTWAPTKKLEMLDMFCQARGYLETIDGAPNPQTKKDFVNADVMRYLMNICNNEKRRQAVESVVIDGFEAE